jgi:hypothetical protein
MAALACNAAAISAGDEPVLPAVAEAARPLPLSAVRLTGGPLKNAQDLDAQYLLALEPDRMLAGYRLRAGLEPKAPGYGGWDSVEGKQLTGHVGGHYLSAVSLMWAATGDPRFKERADYLVRELKEVQDKHGDGYHQQVVGAQQARRLNHLAGQFESLRTPLGIIVRQAVRPEQKRAQPADRDADLLCQFADLADFARGRFGRQLALQIEIHLHAFEPGVFGQLKTLFQRHLIRIRKSPQVDGLFHVISSRRRLNLGCRRGIGSFARQALTAHKRRPKCGRVCQPFAASELGASGRGSFVCNFVL